VDPIDQQPDEVETVERRGLPGGQLRRRLRDEPAAHRALARPPAAHRRRHWLQAAGIPSGRHAHEHLLDDPAIQRIDIRHGLERGQRHLLAPGADPGAADGDLPPAEHHLAGHGAPADGLAVGEMGIPRPTHRGPIVFEHRVQHLQPGPDRELEQLTAGIHQEVDQGQMAGRFNSDRPNDCARLLHGGSLSGEACASGLVTTRVARAATEPPLQFSTAIGTSPERRH